MGVEWCDPQDNVKTCVNTLQNSLQKIACDLVSRHFLLLRWCAREANSLTWVRNIYPRCSMYGIFTYVWAIFWGKCRYIFQHHGAFGYYKHPCLEFYQNLVIPSNLLNSKSLREKLTLRDDRCDGSVPAMVQCHGFPMWARAQSAWMETENPDHQPKILHSNPQKEEGCRTVKSLKIVVSECKCSFRSCLHLFTLPQTSIPIRCMWGALNLSPTRILRLWTSGC